MGAATAVSILISLMYFLTRRRGKSSPSSSLEESVASGSVTENRMVLGSWIVLTSFLVVLLWRECLSLSDASIAIELERFGV